jgi:hypothetical protein
MEIEELVKKLKANGIVVNEFSQPNQEHDGNISVDGGFEIQVCENNSFILLKWIDGVFEMEPEESTLEEIIYKISGMPGDSEFSKELSRV